MISFSGVGLAFDKTEVFMNLTFRFDRGGIYVLRGGSGQGKTSLLNMAAGYTRPDAGIVESEGTVEYLMQEELLFSKLTAVENLSIRHPHRSEHDILAAISSVGLAGRGHQAVTSLSGGERRRVELAGSLLADPGNLLLDEPVANLDAQTALDIYGIVANSPEDRTTIIVTHEKDTSHIPGPVVGLRLDRGVITHE